MPGVQSSCIASIFLALCKLTVTVNWMHEGPRRAAADLLVDHIDVAVLVPKNHKEPKGLEQLPNGKWNCSVPQWTEFSFHFACNILLDCVGLEDERGCAWSSHCGPHRLTINGRCYQVAAREMRVSWYEAQFDCQERGGSLSSLGSWQEANNVLRTLKARSMWVFIYIGGYLPSDSMPEYYKYNSMYLDKTLNRFVQFGPNCHKTCCFCVYMSDAPTFIALECWYPIVYEYLCEFEDGSKLTGKEGLQEIKVSTALRIQPQAENALFPLPTSQCPGGHFTHLFLACDPFSSCWGISTGMGMSVSTDKTGRPSPSFCPAPVPPAALPPLFLCGRVKAALAYSLVCDGQRDCLDSSDEDFCLFSSCADPSMARCSSSSRCLPTSLYHNDGQKDCHDGSDENVIILRDRSIFPYGDKKHNYHRRSVLDFDVLDDSSPFIAKPLPADALCPETHFQCEESDVCVPVYTLCNGVYDCINHRDEDGCQSYSCPGFYRCRGSPVCLHASHVCDGRYQCPQKDDEMFCSLPCPSRCTCQGLAYVCPAAFPADGYRDVRYLDGSGSGMGPGDLANNSMLIFLSLASCRLRHLNGLTHFPNLHVLDVGSNLIGHVSLTQLALLVRLRTLVLANIPVAPGHIFRSTTLISTVHSLIVLDISNVSLPELYSGLLVAFSRLQILNISGSGTVRITRGALNHLSDLRVLDLRGSRVPSFPQDVFRGLSRLQQVFADNYKLCCPATLPSGLRSCRAPFDEVSSCEVLLRSDLYRAVLSLFAVLCVIGNTCSLAVRLLWLRDSRRSGFSVLVTHLSLSDLLMGVYLSAVGVADRRYLGSYLWEESAWRTSAVCQAAGFLSLLSSEMSALVVCLITLDRFLVLRFPLSGARLGLGGARAACACLWTACLVLAAVPLLPGHAHWRFYSQTGICIPLPVTPSGSFPGHDYAFGIIVVFNFVLFLFIALGQVAVYVSVVTNRMDVVDATTTTTNTTTSRKGHDVRIARRLLSVALSDLLCWFPIGLMGLLAAGGMPVPSEVRVALAVLVLPLNSALNPFLYTAGVVVDRRARARHARLAAQMMAEIEAAI